MTPSGRPPPSPYSSQQQPNPFDDSDDDSYGAVPALPPPSSSTKGRPSLTMSFDDGVNIPPTPTAVNGNDRQGRGSTIKHQAQQTSSSPNSAARFPQTTSAANNSETHEKRARRRREEAVARLVADVTRPPDVLIEHPQHAQSQESPFNFKNDVDNPLDPHDASDGDATLQSPTIHTPNRLLARLRSQQHANLLLASTVASSIERGLDRELHSELVRQGKEATEKISKICHDFSEDFLESVGKVVCALGGPCEEVRSGLEEVSQTTCIRASLFICPTHCPRYQTSFIIPRPIMNYKTKQDTKCSPPPFDSNASGNRTHERAHSPPWCTLVVA
jgi:hypothetical protein